ncbi:MAG: hypothetical protein HY290_08920 [Planctomycetia bacterium]|nr:hypothetical protein [Planctomycetia bacterium]
MARMKRGAKSQAVRDYFAANPGAGAKAVVEGLAEKGINVKVTLVNSIKYKKPAKGGKRRGRRPMTMQAAARRTSANGSLSVENLIEVKRLADLLGGADQVRQALEALAQLQQ